MKKYLCTFLLTFIMVFVPLRVYAGENAVVEETSHPLVGTWVWDGYDGYIYTFYNDGSGSRGFVPLLYDFEWNVVNGDHLLLTFMETTLESWSYAIADDVLTINSRQVPDMEYSYIRISTVPMSPETELREIDANLADHPLIGSWAWDVDDEFIYVFNNNGLGHRGFVPMIQQFEWQVENDNHLILSFEGTLGIAESWTYIIVNDVLTVSSRQFPGMAFNYLLNLYP